ncbi:MAG TPA: nitrite reductase large subunit NirB [Phycisphaerae bacterium]|nr:nitrite reductase large subunit NirB [Phycisphaerae bacterium]
MIRPQKQKLVILGNGMAGARTAEEILQRAPEAFEITIIGAEPHGNYNRILLSNILNGTQTADEITINSIEWYKQNGIHLIAGAPAIGISLAKRTVGLLDGRQIPFDKLIIATGSRPFVPPIPGIDLYGVYTFRTLEDCSSIAKFAKKSKVAAVIGGGLLGLEAAKGLMTHGPAVHIVEMAPHLMAVQVDSAGGAILGKTIASLGAIAHTNKATAEILSDAGSRVRALKFKDGSELACDMVVISAGIRPNLELAKEAGLATERAIVVDDQMLTGDPDVYAVGECAQHRGKCYGLVAPLYEQCKVVADHITQANPGATYTGSFIATKLKVMGVNVASMGERDELPADEVVRYQEPDAAGGGVYKKLIIRNNKLAGAILVGDTEAYEGLAEKMKSQAELPRRRAELLFGAPTECSAEFSLASMPDDKQICDCNGVCKGKIVEAIKAGKTTVQAVGKATRAGTGCGSCKKLVKSLIEAVAGEVKADPAEAFYVPAIPMDKPALTAEIRNRGLRAVSQVMEALATKEDEKSKMGLAILLRAIWGKEYIDERDCRFVNDRLHGNIQKDGTFSVIPRIYGGVTTADELLKIANVAKKYSVPTVKLTGGQRIDLLGIKKEDLPAVWKDLNMVSGYAYTKAFRTCKTCVGSEWCRFGTNDSTALGIAIERKFQGIETPAKVKMAVSGCPRNCAEATCKDVGIIATEGGEWEIYVGGAAGVSVRKGDVLCRVKSQVEAIRITARFMQYYQEHARYLERTYDFVPRIGIEKLRAVLIEDSEGIAAALDERVQRYLDAVVDPWVEDTKSAGGEGVYPGQFAPVRTVTLPVLATI